jgi:hypothetical protein
MSYYMNVLVQRWNALGDKDEEYKVGGCKLNHQHCLVSLKLYNPCEKNSSPWLDQRFDV